MLFGKVKQVIFFIISLLFGVSVNGQTGRVFRYHFDGDLRSGNVIAGEQRIIINYSITELSLESTGNSFGEFFRVSIPGHNPTSDAGKPEVPVLSRLIIVPEKSTINVRISEIKSETIVPSKNHFNGKLYPRQPGQTKAFQNQKVGFTMDKSVYNRRGIISADTVRIEYLGKLRNRQLATLTIAPLRYNPYSNEIEVITSMKVEINFLPEKDGIPNTAKGVSAPFNSPLDKGILNYNPEDVITGYTDKPVSMIILTDTIFRKKLKPLIDWKTQKGFKITTLYKGAHLAGNTYTQIKDTLTKIYKSGTEENPPPEYLLIVGDVSKIPVSEGTSNVSDMYYGEFDGSGDYIPDMFIGRLPVADTAELNSVVRKIIQYEKFEFADTNRFYRRALVTAGVASEYMEYMNGQVKYASSNYLNPANNIEGFHFYHPQSGDAEDSIKKLFKKGLSFINYTGHGDSDGWLDPTIKVAEVALLENKNMYPFVISNACLTGQYNLASSFGNKLIVSKNKGAIGFIGCSNNSYWDEDYYWAVGLGKPSADPKYESTGLGALDRLFHTHNESPSDWFITMGQVNSAGNLAVSASTSLRKKYYWETYTLLGDPSMIPLIGQPGSFKPSLPDTLPNGIQSLSLILEPFSYIAVSHFDTLWDASFVSPSGSVALNLPSGLKNDSCLVVITGQNRVPFIRKIFFKDVNKEFINLTATGINDVSANNNGRADYGESLYLSLTISNLGLTDANQVTAKISSTSKWITINSDFVTIGTLPAKTQIILPNNFSLKISDSIPDKGYETLYLTLKDSETEKKYTIDVSLHAPVLNILNCTIDDTGSGNSNYSAEPGETVDLVFKVKNSGSSNTSGTFSITNLPNGLTISEPNVNTGTLAHNEIKNIYIRVLLSPILKMGNTFDINSLLICNSYSYTRTFSVPVGKTRESFEYGKLTIFPWEISKTNPWIITDNQAFEGQLSARSAVIPNLNESSLRISINSPVKDTVRFYVKVSSEANYDFLTFKLNSKQIFSLSGETDWLAKKVTINEGFNSLEWIYKKDDSYYAGADAGWLDYLVFPPTVFNKTDLKTGKIVTPQPNKNYAQEQITAQIINLGIDTVKKFNLAYSVNETNLVAQQFTRTIKPGDTTVVAFSQLANLIGNGSYNISVFGFNNGDNYLLNDTAKLFLVNTSIFTPVEKPDNNIVIIPNPFKSQFRILTNSKSGDRVRISIFESTGRMLWEEYRDLVPGENDLTIIPEIFSPGFYTLRIAGKVTFKAARIIKSE